MGLLLLVNYWRSSSYNEILSYIFINHSNAQSTSFNLALNSPGKRNYDLFHTKSYRLNKTCRWPAGVLPVNFKSVYCRPMEISISHIRLHEVLAEIAEQLNATEINYSCNETVIVIPYRFGKGYIRGINFGEGLGLLTFSCTFNDDVVFRYSLNRSHPLRLMFCQQGNITYQFEPDNIELTIEALHASLSTSTKTYDQQYCFSANTEIEFTSLEIDRIRYIDKIDCDLHTIPKRLAKVLRDINAEDPFTYQSRYSLELADIVYQIHHTTYEGLARKSYLEARTLDLFAEVIQLFADDQQPNSKQVLLRKSDLTTIVEARDLMMADLSKNVTIPELAKAVGINTTKLKQGFKAVYGQTVNEYIRDKRMEVAKDYILEGSLSVKQISEKVGYKNYAYFSARFRERYGAVPSEYLKNRALHIPLD